LAEAIADQEWMKGGQKYHRNRPVRSGRGTTNNAKKILNRLSQFGNYFLSKLEVDSISRYLNICIEHHEILVGEPALTFPGRSGGFDGSFGE